jgi:hypothetical protein
MKERFDIPAKKVSRKRLRSFIRRTVLKNKSPSEVKVLSLVGPEAIDVFDIYDPIGIPRENIVACELNHDSAELLKAQDLNIIIIEGDVIDYLRDTDRTFDIINLDFCGCLNSDVISAVKQIFYKRTLREGGILACTFLGRRENKEVKMIMKEPYMSLNASASKELYKMYEESKKECDEHDIHSLLNITDNKIKNIDIKKMTDIPDDINRLGIPLKIIHLALLGTRPVIDGTDILLFSDYSDNLNVEEYRNILNKVEKKLEYYEKRNIKSNINGEDPRQFIEKQRKGLESRIRDYKECDKGFLSWKGAVPTSMEFYRYLSDKGSPMMNLYFKFEFIENVYKRFKFDAWYRYLMGVYRGQTMPQLHYIKSSEKEIEYKSSEVEKGSEEMPKKIPHKMDDATKKRILKALRANVDKDKIARIFGVTKMQVSALDAWRTMGKY